MSKCWDAHNRDDDDDEAETEDADEEVSLTLEQRHIPERPHGDREDNQIRADIDT